MQRFLSAGVLSVLLGFSVPAVAQDNPLAFFPETTALVLRMQQPDRTIEKAAQLVDAVQPGAGQFVNQASDQLGTLLSNPGMVGVDQTKDWYVAVVLAEAGQPVPVFAIPATDTAAMVDAVDELMNTQVQGNWVLYCEKPATLPEVGTTNITGKLTGPAAELFGKAEVGIFLNTTQVSEVYADRIEEMRQQVLTNIENLRNTPNVDLTAAVEIYQDLANKFFKVLADSSHLTIAATFGEKGVQFEDYLVVTEGTRSDQWIAAHPAAALPLLEKLPKGQQAYYGVSGLWNSIVVWGPKMMGMAANADKKAEIEAVTSELGNAKVGGMVGSLKFGGQPFFQSTGVMEGELGEEFKLAMRKLQTLSGEINVNGIKQTTTVAPDAEEIGELKVDVITVKQEVLNDAADPTGLQKQLNERMFGTDGIQTRTVYEPQRMTYMNGSLDELDAVLKRFDGSATNRVSEQLATLPQPANVVGLVDLPIMYGEFFKLLGAMEGFPMQIDPSMIDNLNLQQSYTGFAAVTEPHAARLRVEIPVEQIQGVIKLGTVVFVVIQQQGGLR